MLTVLGASLGTLVLRVGLSRHAAMRLAAVIVAVWCAACAAAMLLPTALRPPYILACTLLIATANLVSSVRANARADAAAPRARGRYLAAFQYAFTIAGVVAPGVTGLFSVASWLPWLLVASLALAGAVAFRWIIPRLPSHTLVTAEVSQS